MGRILSSEQFANADFTADNYNVARITVEQIDDSATTPEPGVTLSLLILAGISFVAHRQRVRHS